MTETTEVHRAVEVTLVVDDAFEVPGLVELVRSVGAATPWVEAGPETRLARTTYYDTADLALARHGLTLRRCAGGGDPGWHLEVTEADAAAEAPARLGLRLPPGRAGAPLPEALRRMVRPARSTVPWCRSRGSRRDAPCGGCSTRRPTRCSCSRTTA